MKQILIITIALFSISQSFGQDVLFSKPQRFNSKSDIFTIGGWVEDRLMVYYTDKKGSYLDLYDAQMERKAIVTLNFMPSAPKRVQILPQAQQALMLYSAQINNKEFFYLARLNKEGKILGKPRTIDTAVQNFFGNTKQNYNLIHSSTNDRAGVFSYRIRDAKLEFSYTLADDSLNIVHSSNRTVATKSFYDVAQVVLKDDGRLVVLLTDLSTNKNDEVAEAMVYIITPESRTKAEVKAFSFDFGDVFAANIYLKEDIANSNKIHFAGLTRGRMGAANGLFSGSVDLLADNNSKITGTAINFNEDFNVTGSNKSGQNNNFMIQDLVVKNDGGMVIIAESSARIVRSNFAGPGLYGFGYGTMTDTRYTEYYYGNILLLDINADQSLNWYSSVPKWQRSVDDFGLYSSYCLLNTGADLSFVYNEMQQRGFKINAATVDLNGRQELKVINTQTKSDIKWIPKMGQQTRATEMVIPITGGNKLQFAKVSF